MGVILEVAWEEVEGAGVGVVLAVSISCFPRERRMRDASWW